MTRRTSNAVDRLFVACWVYVGLVQLWFVTVVLGRSCLWVQGCPSWVGSLESRIDPTEPVMVVALVPISAVAGVCIANSPRGARRWMPLLVSAPIFAAEVLLFPFALAPIQTSAASVVEIALSPVVAEIESHIAQKGRPPLRVKTEPGPVGVLACQTIKYEFPAMPTSSGRTAEWRLRVRCQDWSRRSEYVYPSTGEYVGLPRALLPKSMEHVPARVIPMD